MPRENKKGRKRVGLVGLSDLTLGDFADCPRPQSCARVKKSVVGARAAEVMTTPGAATKTDEAGDEMNWFDKDLGDFVIDDAPSEEEEEDLAFAGAKSSQTRARNQKLARKEKFDNGVIYPADVWYWISLYVDPEDIGRFAGICKGAHHITLTAAFWRTVYERVFHPGKENLPDNVKPHSMEKLHGLRARVICSLFYLHVPFVARTQGKGPMEDEPHCLKGHRCLLVWHQPAPKGWQFCFKFQKPSLQSLSSRPVRKDDVYHGYNDLFYNPEGGCSVLQVTCCHFASVPCVMGLLLNQVYVTLSAGFRHHRLRLHFDSCFSANQNMPSDTVVVIDDVIAIKVFQWWQPGYPFKP